VAEWCVFLRITVRSQFFGRLCVLAASGELRPLDFFDDARGGGQGGFDLVGVVVGGRGGDVGGLSGDDLVAVVDVGGIGVHVAGEGRGLWDDGELRIGAA
jgi:hypothetical protein